MGRPRKTDPVKHCQHCNALLTRKMYGTQLEDRSCFKRRKFCNAACMGLSKIKEPTNKSAIYRAARRAVPLKSACELCGTKENLGRHHLNENPRDNRPENVKTLCATCHTKWHWSNGKKTLKSKASCSVCGKHASRRGLCQKHWFRFAKYGDPLLTKRGNMYGFRLVHVSIKD